jgi:hypothetical protein
MKQNEIAAAILGLNRNISIERAAKACIADFNRDPLAQTRVSRSISTEVMQVLRQIGYPARDMNTSRLPGSEANIAIAQKLT